MRGEAEDGGQGEPGRGNPQLAGTNGSVTGDGQRSERSGKGEAAESDRECLPDDRGTGPFAFA